MNLVVDSSVIVKWFVKKDEQDLARAMWLKNQFLAGKCNLVVPDLIFYEIANVLKTKKEFRQKTVLKAINLLFDYRFQSVWPSSTTFVSAAGIAYKHQLSVYDAVYLAIAKETGYPFLTADKKLLIKEDNLDVCLLKDLKNDTR